MSEARARWGDQVAVEILHGVPYRMYVDRPHRVEELLEFTRPWGARPYVLQGDRVLTFDDLRGAVAAKVAELHASGVRPGDRLFLLGWNSVEWVVNFWACIAAGAVPVLANTWWSGAEVANGLAAIAPRLTLADAAAGAKMPPASPLGPWAVQLEARDGEDAAVPPATSPDEDATALVIFTSGTSGQPKAVVLSHRALLARLQMTLHITRKLPGGPNAKAPDVTLLTGPLFHVGSMQALLRALVVGDTLVLAGGRFDPADVLALIERHGVHRWNAVPTMVSRVLDHPDLPRRDLGSLKSISVGGAPVHAELMRRIHTALPGLSPRIPTGYGLTENGGQATASAGSEKAELLGSTGKPLPCVEVRFLARPGLPDGEVLLRSPTQMSGYHGLAESPIDAEGWLHTGDLGHLDAEGNLWITGRCKEMIIRGGENIAPAAIEHALATIPGVAEAVVFGVPHADLGEEVMAVVVVDRPLMPEQLQLQLRTRIASFAVPSRWRLQHDPLPTNHTGKVDKVAIRAQVVAELEHQQAVNAG